MPWVSASLVGPQRKMVGNSRLGEAGGSVCLLPEPELSCTLLEAPLRGICLPWLLAERSLCRIPVSPSPFRQYSPGEADTFRRSGFRG